MNRIKSFIVWTTERSFRTLLIFILLYIWWFLLTPWDLRPVSPYDPVYFGRFTYANSNYLVGIILLSLYSASSIFTRLTNNHGCWSVLTGVSTIFFLVINAWYIAWALPRIDDVAPKNGAMYLVVYYPTWPDRPYIINQFTKWNGFFNYRSDTVYSNLHLYLRYDEKLRQMNVVEVFPLGYERLIYSDSNPSRHYDSGEVDFEGKRYYPSLKCNPNPKAPYLCESYTYAIYQCELDNTLCAPLPFRYTGDYYFWLYVEKGPTRNDINISFDVGDYPGVKTLIFTYGDNSRCHVEGCELIEVP